MRRAVNCMRDMQSSIVVAAWAAFHTQFSMCVFKRTCGIICQSVMPLIFAKLVVEYIERKNQWYGSPE